MIGNSVRYPVKQLCLRRDLVPAVEESEEDLTKPHHQAELQRCPDQGLETHSHAHPGQGGRQLGVEPERREAGVLAQEHLQHEERAPEHEAEQDVDQEKHEAAVPDDGHGQRPERVQGEGEGPGGGQEVQGPGPALRPLSGLGERGLGERRGRGVQSVGGGGPALRQPAPVISVTPHVTHLEIVRGHEQYEHLY